MLNIFSIYEKIDEQIHGLVFLEFLEFKQIQPRYVCFRDLQQNAR